jgi:predicted nucleic acid-binding Zn ribbon protein
MTAAARPAWRTQYSVRWFIRCTNCGHRGTAVAFMRPAPRFKCRKCGARDVLTFRDDGPATSSRRARR